MRIFFVTKWILAGVFFFAAFSVQASAIPGLTIYSPGLDTGLVAHWTFDGEDMTSNVVDRVGVHHAILIKGDNATTTISGPLGQALVLDGVNDFVFGPVIETAEVPPYSFSFWFKTDQQTLGYFFSQSNSIYSYIDSAGKVGFVTSVSGTGSLTSPLAYDDGRWHHAVVVASANNARELFVDGASVDTNAVNVGNGDISAFFVLGQRAAVNYFNGALDDFRIYNKALSLSDVRRLYSLGAAMRIAYAPLIAESARTRIASTPVVPAGQGLVGHWTFDGKNMISNVTDSSGSGNTGKLILGATGNIATTTSPGVLGQALLFDGLSDYVNAGAVDGLGGTKNFTVSAWVKTDTLTGGDSNLREIVSQSNAFSATTFILRLNTASDYIEFLVGGTAGYSGTANSGASSITTDTWYHVAAVYDGANLQIYLNGTAAGSPVARTLVVGTDAAEMHIGNAWRGGINDRYWSGAIDDVRVYNRSFSAAEIRQLYRTGQPKSFASRRLNQAPTPSNAGMYPYYANLGGGAQNVTLYMNVWTDPDGDAVTGYYFEFFANNSNCSGTPTSNSGWIADPTATGGFTVSVDDATTNTWRVKAKDASGKESAWSECVAFDNSGGGSCPYVFGWDGKKYQFEVDIFGSGGLGYKKWGLDDFVQPTPNRTYVLKNTEPKNGLFEWRIVGDLAEVDYFDYWRMYSYHIPENRDIIVESPTLGSGANAKSILHTVSTEPLLPERATRLDTHKDVTEDVQARDGKKVIINKNKKETYEYEMIEIDFGDISQYPTKKLIIGGSTTYPVTEEGIARKQQFGLEWGLFVQDAEGTWKKVPNNLYSPTKPLSFDSLIAVDISKIFISKNTKIRLQYLYKVYIDYVALDVTEDLPLTVTEEHPIIDADLHDFNGWHEFDKDGHTPDFYDVVPLEDDYADFPGYYTKFGKVDELLEKRDDKFVVMAKADEVTVKNAPPNIEPAEGYKRVYMLDVSGYYKALGKTQTEMAVEPMPFSNMSAFPYPETEHYPDTPEYQAYLSEWNTRYLSPEKERKADSLLNNVQELLSGVIVE